MEIKAGFDLTNSPMIHYYLKNLEMSYFQLEENYPNARSICLELLGIVRNNKSVYRRQRVGVVYDNLSRCEFYLGNFAQAAKCAREAQKVFNQGSENYCIALEQEFYALFALKQYGQSAIIADKMITSAAREELGKFQYSRSNYLLANALFMRHKFKDALALLTEEREIAKDKAGWEIGARVLTIMTLVEMEKEDEAGVAIIGLKQFIKRTDKKDPVSRRDKTILNLLLMLERTGFVFKDLGRVAEKHLGALQSTHTHTAWEPFTHEVIRFHEWFAGKKHIPRRSGVQVGTGAGVLIGAEPKPVKLVPSKQRSSPNGLPSEKNPLGHSHKEDTLHGERIVIERTIHARKQPYDALHARWKKRG